MRDKSKPVRKAIEDWYARNMEAFKAKDVAAIMALRTDDFHTITPDGKVNTRADMETRTRLFLDRIDHFISQDNQIGTIEVEGDLASADITQKTVRMQRFPDGTLHKVEAGRGAARDLEEDCGRLEAIPSRQYSGWWFACRRQALQAQSMKGSAT